ncbi:hypothetical protein BDU57DRAFT_514195 [Ampelomyces quisqualis]|uniref:Uncharacterized protein n=1 Tax=Ampelomyces quisqualis TaxID=50730 RepID=A0A6A5QT34_AMPQU|nr:hypothetical protein BDU57DRAFT_514195 [Ampelomyces quisqualis]
MWLPSRDSASRVTRHASRHPAGPRSRTQPGPDTPSMPTHTPSPHRFLAPSTAPTQKAKPKPPSTLRNNLVATPSTSAAETRDIYNAPAKRFVVTPHCRSHSAEEKRRDRGGEARVLSHTHFTPRPKPRRKLERIESIGDTSQSSPNAPPIDHDGPSMAQTVEHGLTFDDGVQNAQETDEEEDENLFLAEQRSKRRRVSPGSSSIPGQPSEPTTPVAPPHNSTTHRFLVPPPRTPALFTTLRKDKTPLCSAPPTTSAPHRPAFILPPQPTSPPKPSRSLPEVFSPSRKTQKYIPNGLASTLQGWIIETANTGFAAHERNTGHGVVWARDREDGVRLKVRVTAASSSGPNVDGDVECVPGYFVFIQGDTEPGLYSASRAPGVAKNNGELKVVLAGQGGARSAGGVSIRIGGVVGVRAPMWDVDVAGEKWMVGVDWVLL